MGKYSLSWLGVGPIVSGVLRKRGSIGLGESLGTASLGKEGKDLGVAEAEVDPLLGRNPKSVHAGHISPDPGRVERVIFKRTFKHCGCFPF